MKKSFFTIFLFLFIVNGFLLQMSVVTHTVEKNSEKNEYQITSVFLGAFQCRICKSFF